jgi:hypothetical protein
MVCKTRRHTAEAVAGLVNEVYEHVRGAAAARLAILGGMTGPRSLALDGANMVKTPANRGIGHGEDY